MYFAALEASRTSYGSNGSKLFYCVQSNRFTSEILLMRALKALFCLRITRNQHHLTEVRNEVGVFTQ